MLYLLVFLIKRHPLTAPDFTALIFVVVDSVGVIVDINVARISLTATRCSDTPIEQIYLFIGGFAVLYLCCKDLWSKHKEIG